MNAEQRARSGGIPIVDFDPECDPAFKADPLGTILAAQQLGDVLYSTAARGFWVITRHELFKEICQDPGHYSNRETFTFYATRRRCSASHRTSTLPSTPRCARSSRRCCRPRP